jgi:hypothetical protein
MSEVTVEVAEKAGMLVGGNNQTGFTAVDWVMAGEEYELQEGDILVTHHKTAQKYGLGDVYKEMKAENAPVKVVDGDKKPRGPRQPVPKEGVYTVVKPELLDGEPCERTDLCQLLASKTDLADFWAEAPKTFKHANRKGEAVEFLVSGLVGYAIKRGIIVLDV